MGSSPLARGLRRRIPGRPLPCGIIPARAGFTASRTRPAPWGRDHPRSRGVYVEIFSVVLLMHGSSPLARGLPGDTDPVDEAPRIIPARAGFTQRGSQESRSWGDHPRSRGVYCGGRDEILASWGSSPLARGLQGDHGGGRRVRRIIPARAGFTLPSRDHRPIPPDHPRSRGVYPDGYCGQPEVEGSSPLARGLQGRRGRKPLGEGIIPARAGFTGDR